MAHLTSGKTAPDFSLTGLDGETHSLGSLLHGGPVVVAFFKISCPVCQFTFPYLQRIADRFAGKGVAGFDLAGDESLYNNLTHYEKPFAIARAAGLGLTCHAAEAAPGSAAREAVERFGVTRIGHGAHLREDRESLRWVRDHGVVVECCPTSNWYTGAIARRRDHPAKYFREQNLKIVLGDDNPIQTKSLLSNERRVLIDELGFTQKDLRDWTKRAFTQRF